MTLRRVFNNAVGIIANRRNNRELSRPGSYHRADEFTVFKSGFAQLDRAIGIGGLPAGQVVELIGQDSAGGVSVAAKIAAKFQRKQHAVTILDAVGGFDLAHTVRCGLVAPELLYQQPKNALALVHLMETAASTKGLVIVYLGFIPSTFVTVPTPSLFSLMRRLYKITHQADAVCLYLTLMSGDDPFTLANYLPGFPLSDVADVRLWVQDEGWIRRDEQIGGYRGNITVIQNALAPSGKGANIRIPFVDPEILRLSDELGF